MTTDLEKQFFDTFDIKQREYTQCCSMGCKKPYTDCVNCQYHEVYKIDYPRITDRILLELICIANQHEIYPISTNIKNIQARTLRILLRTEKLYKKYYGSDGLYKKLVKQVRTLFKEG